MIFSDGFTPFRLDMGRVMSSREEIEYPRADDVLIPEVEDELNLSIDDFELSELDWQKRVFSLYKEAEAEDGWYFRDIGSERLPWMPESSRPGEEYGLLDFIQYYTRGSRIRRNNRLLGGLCHKSDEVRANFQLFSDLSDGASNGEDKGYVWADYTLLAELTHLGLHQNLDLDSLSNYDDASLKREEVLVDEVRDRIFEDIYGESSDCLEGAQEAAPYHERLLAWADKFVSALNKEFHPELDPHQAYEEMHIPSEVYDFETGLSPEQAETWINEGKL